MWLRDLASWFPLSPRGNFTQPFSCSFLSLQQFANDTGSRLRDFDVVVMGNGVRTIIETAKIRRLFGSSVQTADPDGAVESYQNQMGNLIPVITFKCHQYGDLLYNLYIPFLLVRGKLIIFCSREAFLPSFACFQIGQKFLLIRELFFRNRRQIYQLVWVALDVVNFHKALIILRKTHFSFISISST